MKKIIVCVLLSLVIVGGISYYAYTNSMKINPLCNHNKATCNHDIKVENTCPYLKLAVAKQKYTCPMHPEVISDKQGKCPKCGMNLVPVKKK